MSVRETEGRLGFTGRWTGHGPLRLPSPDLALMGSFPSSHLLHYPPPPVGVGSRTKRDKAVRENPNDARTFLLGPWWFPP